MNDVLITVIVPIYNVERYLKECLESIKVVFDNINVEILLIDDGSKDSSGDIAESYASNYKNIRVFHKENGGLSDARNYGLYQALGKYVIFIDSDDIIESNNFKNMVDQLEICNGDIYLWNGVEVNENGQKMNLLDNNYFVHSGLEENKVYSGVESIYLQLLNHDDYVTTVWLGAYKKSFLINNNLWFEKGLLHEDELWTIKTLICANSVEYFDKTIYLYRQRENSIMNQVEKKYTKNIKDISYIYTSLYSYVNWKISVNKYARLIKGNISKRYLHALNRFKINRDLYKKNDIKALMILNNSNRSIDKIRSIILFISPWLYCEIYKIFKQNKEMN